MSGASEGGTPRCDTLEREQVDIRIALGVSLARDLREWKALARELEKAYAPSAIAPSVDAINDILSRAEALGWNDAGYQEGLCDDPKVEETRAKLRAEALALFQSAPVSVAPSEPMAACCELDGCIELRRSTSTVGKP